MTEELKKESNPQEKKIFDEYRGKYVMIDGTKMFAFEFPFASNVAENYVALSYLRDKVWKAMEEQKKREEAQKEKSDKQKDLTESNK